MATTTSDVQSNPAPDPAPIPAPNPSGDPLANAAVAQQQQAAFANPNKTDPNAASAAAGRNPNPDRNVKPNPNAVGGPITVKINGKDQQFTAPTTRRMIYDQMQLDPTKKAIVQIIEEPIGPDNTTIALQPGQKFEVRDR